MQVIKHGNTYKEIECPQCNALLSYCNKDIEERYDIGEYNGEMYHIFRTCIICPECRKQIALNVYEMKDRRKE